MPETGYTRTVGYDKILTTELDCAGTAKLGVLLAHCNKRMPAGQKREKYEDHFLWHP